MESRVTMEAGEHHVSSSSGEIHSTPSVDLSGGSPWSPTMTRECTVFDLASYTVVGGSVCGFGIIGNFLSCLVLNRTKDPKYHKGNKTVVTSFLLSALAVADALLSVAAIPLYVLQPLSFYQATHNSFVRYLWPMYQMPYTGTVLLTVLVSFNRYMAACRPFSGSGSDLVTSRRHVFAVVVFSVLYNIPRFFEYQKESHFNSKLNRTEEMFSLSPLGSNTLYRIIYCNLLYFLLIHGGPLLCLSFLNYKLLAALRKRHRRKEKRRVESIVLPGGAVEVASVADRAAERDRKTTFRDDADGFVVVGNWQTSEERTPGRVLNESVGRLKRDIESSFSRCQGRERNEQYRSSVSLLRSTAREDVLRALSLPERLERCETSAGFCLSHVTEDTKRVRSNSWEQNLCKSVGELARPNVNESKSEYFRISCRAGNESTSGANGADVREIRRSNSFRAKDSKPSFGPHRVPVETTTIDSAAGRFDGKTRQHQQQKQDLTLVLIVVVFTFIFCHTPSFVDTILWTILDGSQKGCGRWLFYYTAIADLLVMFNSSANFAIYVLTSPRFRSDLVSYLAGDRFKRCRH